MVEKWQVQKHEHDCGQQSVANANAPPVERQQHNRKKFHGDRQRERDGRNRAPAAYQRGEGHHQQQYAENIDVTAARHFCRQQRMPRVGQNPVRCLPSTTQDIEQDKNNGKFANHKCYSHARRQTHESP